ncbi:fatty acid desaturase-domain-containing protein [Schizophyllum fasciatum]
MPWYQIFRDGPEYEKRAAQGSFSPPNFTPKQLYDAVPSHLFVRSTAKSSLYILRHLAITALFFCLATRIDRVVDAITTNVHAARALRGVLWLAYWGWQGMAFTGIWAGHDSFSPHPIFNTIVGMVLHTLVLTPFHAWRATHRSHHKHTNSMENDETYHPVTRRELALPDARIAVKMDYAEVLEDTPAFTLFKLFVRQFLYGDLHNRKGNPKYPPGTSHYRPSSLLFKPVDWAAIVISNIAICCMICLIAAFIHIRGWREALAHYLMPWLLPCRLVMITYLQHSDPTIPYYRKEQWTFVRGALATVDRPLFGWAGRFFLHNISSDHVAHHFFSTVPFYNLPAVTEAMKPVLGEYYNYDSTGVLKALWRSFTQCRFVEDDGAVLFFKNDCGDAVLSADVSKI